MEERAPRLARIILLVAILAYGLYFSLYQIQRHRAFWTYVDLMAMEQTIWNTLQGDFMRSTVYPPTGQVVRDFSNRETESRLGTHVQPILLLLALPYALLPCSETLLVLMSVGVGLGAIPLFRIARSKFGSPWWALLFAIGYLLLPAVETNSGWDIHGTVFLPPLMLASLDAAESGKRGWWWFWALLAMGCREDIPFLFGWAMLWLSPRELRRDALVMFGVGLGLSLVNFLVIIPHFGAQGTPYIAQFLPPGADLSLAGVLALLKQLPVWAAVGQHTLTYNVLLGLPVLFLYWLHGPALLAMVPTIIINSLNWKPSMHVPSYSHYSAPIVAWVLVGAMEGFMVLERFLYSRWPEIRWRGLLGEAIVVSIIAAHLVTGYTPLSRSFVWPKRTAQEPAIAAVLAQIPADAPVSLGMHMAAHAARRETVRIFPDLREAEWVGINVWLGGNPYGDTTLEALQSLSSDPEWELVRAEGGLILLKRGAGPPQGLERAFRPTGQLPGSGLDALFGEETAGMYLRALSIFPLSAGHFNVCTDWALKAEGAFVPWLDMGQGTSPGLL